MDERRSRSRRGGAKGQTGRRKSTSFWDIPRRRPAAAAAAGGALVVVGVRSTIKKTICCPAPAHTSSSATPFQLAPGSMAVRLLSDRESEASAASRAERGGGSARRNQGKRMALASLEAESTEKEIELPPPRPSLPPSEARARAALGPTAFPWAFSCRRERSREAAPGGQARERERRNI